MSKKLQPSNKSAKAFAALTGTARTSAALHCRAGSVCPLAGRYSRMKNSIMIGINFACALAASIFIYRMLPYAAAVDCGEISQNQNCAALGQYELYGSAVAPFLIVGSLCLTALHLGAQRPKAAKVLLLAVPSIALVLGVYAIGFSVIQL